MRYGEDGPAGSVGKRFATKVVSRAVCTVSGRPAYRLDFEIANVDQPQLSPSSRWNRGRIVLIDVPFDYKVKGNHTKSIYSAVMLAGLATAPEDFGALAPDFEAFLDRVVIAEKRDVLASQASVPSTCRAADTDSAPAAAVPPPAPAPAPTAPNPAVPPASRVAPASEPSSSAP